MLFSCLLNHLAITSHFSIGLCKAFPAFKFLLKYKEIVIIMLNGIDNDMNSIYVLEM